jgi:GT2 family glycosyltransferase
MPTAHVARLPALPDSPTLALGIPTRGRARILHETLTDVLRQTRPPQAIFVAYSDPSDLGDAPQAFPDVTFVDGSGGSGGSCEQRNRLLEAVGDRFDLVFIMDDDCYLHRDYLLRTEQVFVRDPSVVATTGHILENGATGPGLKGDYARGLLGALGPAPTLEEAPPVPRFNTDGCNMAFRVAPIHQNHIRFDESMPGYAWFEDIDFSRRLTPWGRIVLLPAAQAIHLGAKVGKTSGLRYGYSQIANPIYLMRKGVYAWHRVLVAAGRNLAANLVKSLRPEPWIDRRGRLRGNLLAFRDLLTGRLRPDRILQLH